MACPDVPIGWRTLARLLIRHDGEGCGVLATSVGGSGSAIDCDQTGWGALSLLLMAYDSANQALFGEVTSILTLSLCDTVVPRAECEGPISLETYFKEAVVLVSPSETRINFMTTLITEDCPNCEDIELPLLSRILSTFVRDADGATHILTGLVSGGVVVPDPPCTPTVTAVDVGDFPVFIAVDPALGKVFVPNTLGDTISVIDSDTDGVIATITAGQKPSFTLIDPAAGLLYVANVIGNSISVFDTTTHAVVETITGITSPICLALNSATGMLYALSNSATPTGAILTVIDISTHTIVDTVSVADVGGFTTGSDMIVHEALNKVYVAGRADMEVYVVDGATNTVVATIPVATTMHRNKRMALHVALDKIYVVAEQEGLLTVIDCATDTLVTTIPYGSTTEAVAVNQNNDEVYVRISGSCDIIDANTDTSIGSIFGVGSSSEAHIVVDHADNIIYVYDGGGSTIKTYDGDTHVLIHSFGPVGSNAYNMVVDLTRGKIYVSSAGTDKVYVIQECFDVGAPGDPAIGGTQSEMVCDTADTTPETLIASCLVPIPGTCGLWAWRRIEV